MVILFGMVLRASHARCVRSLIQRKPSGICARFDIDQTRQITQRYAERIFHDKEWPCSNTFWFPLTAANYH